MHEKISVGAETDHYPQLVPAPGSAPMHACDAPRASTARATRLRYMMHTRVLMRSAAWTLSAHHGRMRAGRRGGGRL